MGEQPSLERCGVDAGDRAKIEADLKKLNLPIEIRDADGKVIK